MGFVTPIPPSLGGSDNKSLSVLLKDCLPESAGKKFSHNVALRGFH